MTGFDLNTPFWLIKIHNKDPLKILIYFVNLSGRKPLKLLFRLYILSNPVFLNMTNSERAKMCWAVCCWNESDFYFPLFVFIFCSRQWLKSEDIQRISLFFHNKSLEKEVEWRTSAPLTLSAHQPALTHRYSLFFCTLPPSSPSMFPFTRRLTASESSAAASEVPQVFAVFFLVLTWFLFF